MSAAPYGSKEKVEIGDLTEEEMITQVEIVMKMTPIQGPLRNQD